MVTSRAVRNSSAFQESWGLSMLNFQSFFDPSNKFSGIDENAKISQTVYLTPNRYNSMLVLNIDEYTTPTDNVESQLNEADQSAETDKIRYTEDEVFSRIRRRLHAGKGL